MAIPVEEALEIALRVAEALEEAHGKGIVHRDLKPANVKVAPDGKVKVLDFGLAKAWAGESGGDGSSSSALSQSPTLARGGTMAGVVLGTAAYMSPEQARGKAVDKRADVWSFGVLLWEMLTGRALFTGETVTDVIAAVVSREPDLDALPATTPAAVRRLIARCLRKDPRHRLPDIGAARLELQDVIAGSTEEPAGKVAGGAPSVARETRRVARLRWVWAAAFLLAAGLAGYLTVARLTRVPELRAPGNFVLDVPDQLKPVLWGAPAVSPDGRQIAFAAMSKGDRATLWVRPLDSMVSREVPGAEGVLPFWSPDGRSLAFFMDSELRRVSLASGAIQKICGLPTGWASGGDWMDDGTILFSAGGMTARLYTVSAGGGEAKPLTTHDESHGETAHWWPKILPDGRHFLFLVAGRPERAGLHLASLDAPQERRRLLPTLTRADYQAGHLLFVLDQTLFAQPLDVTRAMLTGEPVAIAPSVASWREAFGWGWFAAGSGGLLVYSEGQSPDSELVWFDRKGARLGTVGPPGQFRQIALSPDQRHLAADAFGDGGRDIWTMDVERGVATRQTFGPGVADADPIWSPDGREIVFASNRDGAFRLYRKALYGNEVERPFARAPAGAFPDSWSMGGQVLVHFERAGLHSIAALSASDNADPELILERSYPLDEPQISPDGRWVAFISEESGAWAVSVQPFRRSGERVKVSMGGQPRWRGDGKELFYVDPGGRLMAVEVRASADRLEVARPVVLLEGVIPTPDADKYAVTGDGQRFLVIVPTEAGSRMRVVTNWTSLLPQ